MTAFNDKYPLFTVQCALLAFSTWIGTKRLIPETRKLLNITFVPSQKAFSLELQPFHSNDDKKIPQIKMTKDIKQGIKDYFTRNSNLKVIQMIYHYENDSEAF